MIEGIDLDSLRCLSVKQPWASLIASGRKKYELRPRITRYRGPLVICASASPAREKDANVARMDYAEHLTDEPLGVALCVVEVVDCFRAITADANQACCRIPSGETWFAWKFGNEVISLASYVEHKGQLSMHAPTPTLRRHISNVLSAR